MPTAKFKIDKPPPRPLSSAQILTKYKLPRSAAGAVTRYVVNVITRDRKSRRFVSHKKAVAKKAR